MSGGDYGISTLVSTWKNRRTCIEWNGDDHDCYADKRCPSKKIIQGDEGQSNLASSNKKHKHKLY
jgi:hypothetical protein